MTDNSHEENSDTPEMGFHEILEAYESEKRESLQVGDRVRGKILSIGRDYVFIDTGAKLDGIVEKEELIDESGTFPYTEGDTLDLFVISIRAGELKLSRALTGIGGATLLQDAYQSGIPVIGKVLETCKGGVSVEIIKRRAFCPISQMDTLYIETPESYVGQSFEFLIIELEENGKNIVVSRRNLLEQEQEKIREAFYTELSPGNCYEATVSRIMPFGAFVELTPGVEGMVHISEMSWSRIASPDEILTLGEKIRVKVLSVEHIPHKAEKKISLSMKQVEEDPWNTAQERFKPGLKLRGKVTRCMEYGVFVELAPGIEGLVHISEMSYRKRVTKPQDLVSEGDDIDVMIKDIDVASRRVSLSIKEAEGDPWIDIEHRYQKDQVIEGVIEKKERFGYFIMLEPGITGLMPKSKITQHPDAAVIDKMGVGDRLSVTIEKIDLPQRRISLAPGDARNEDWKEFSRSQNVGMGSLGEKLKQAITSKENE